MYVACAEHSESCVLSTKRCLMGYQAPNEKEAESYMRNAGLSVFEIQCVAQFSYTLVCNRYIFSSLR